MDDYISYEKNLIRSSRVTILFVRSPKDGWILP